MARSRNTADTQTASGGPVSPSIVGKNAIINGGMDIWQRGTSFTVANNTYLMDRWYNTGDTNLTVTRDTDVPTDPYFQYSAKLVGTGTQSITQKIESANSQFMAGKVVTISLYAKKTSGTGALNINIYYPSAKDNFASLTQIGSALQLSSNPGSSWTRYSVTVTMPSNIVNGLAVLIDNVNTHTIFITGVQVELGASATPFSRAGGTIQGELAACQRYYFRTQTGTSGPYIGVTAAGSATATYANIIMKQTMRTSPTSVEFSGLRWSSINNAGNITAASISDATPENVLLVCTTTGATTGAMNYLSGTSNAAYVGFSAEL